MRVPHNISPEQDADAESYFELEDFTELVFERMASIEIPDVKRV